MNHFMITGFFTFITNAILALIIVRKKHLSRLSKFFVLFSVAVGVYGFGFFLQSIAQTAPQEMFAIRIILTGAIFIPIFFMQTAYELLEKRISFRILFLLYLFGFVLESINWTTDLIAKDPIPRLGFKYLFQAGPLHEVYGLFFSGIVIFVLVKLFHGYRTQTGFKRNQIKYFFWGSILGFGGGSPGILLAYGISCYPFNPFGAYGVAAYLFCAYAIIKYRTMSFKRAIRALIPIFVSAGIVNCIGWFFRRVWGAYHNRFFQIDELIIYNIGVMIVFYFVYKGVIILLQKYLPIKDYQELLYDYTKQIGRSNDPKEVFKYMLQILQDENSPRPQNGVILWQQFGGHHYSQEFQFGNKEEIPLYLDYLSPTVKFIEQEYIDTKIQQDMVPIIVRDEIHKIYEKNTDIKNVTENMQRFCAQICIPLIDQDKEGIKFLIGILFLGKPFAGDVYDDEDYHFLKEIARETTKAIINSQVRVHANQVDQLNRLGTMVLGWADKVRNALNNIATSVYGIADIVDRGFDTSKLNEEEKENVVLLKEHSHQAYESLLKAQTFTKDFMPFNKRPLDKEELQKLDMRSMLKTVTDMLAKTGKLSEIHVEISIGDDVPVIEGEKETITTVFIIMLDNAANAVNALQRAGEGWIHIQIHLSRSKKEIEIEIADNGKGMSEQDRKNLGNPLYMTKGGTGSSTKGKGLGVAFAYYYIQNLHHGRVAVESKLGVGTTFYITLPLIQDIPSTA